MIFIIDNRIIYVYDFITDFQLFICHGSSQTIEVNECFYFMFLFQTIIKMIEASNEFLYYFGI